jgi:hypothetical protein
MNGRRPRHSFVYHAFRQAPARRGQRATAFLGSRQSPQDGLPRPRPPFRRILTAIAVVVSVVATALAYGVTPAVADNGTGPADLINVLALQGAGSPLYTATAAQQASLEDLEQQAVANTVADHGLGSADANAAQTWGRDAALAELWGLLVQAINTPADEQTTDEANAVAWLTNVVLQQNIAAADDAGLEYAKWAGLGASAYESLLVSNPTEAQLADFLNGGLNNYGPGESINTPASTSNEGFCTYVPPAPYTTDYTGNIYTPANKSNANQTCYTPCTDVLTNCAPFTPTEAQFEDYGTADADNQSFDNTAWPAVANDVGEEVGFGDALLGAAAAGVGVTTALYTSGALVGTALASVLSPFGGAGAGIGATGVGSLGAGLGSDALAEASAGVAAAEVGGVVTIVLAAIAIGVIEGISIITNALLPGQLAQYVADAPTTAPNLGSMLQGSSGTTELYSLFIGSTLPEPSLSTCDNSQIAIRSATGVNPAPCLNAPPVPGSSESDATLRITEDGSTATTTSSTLNWADQAQGSTNSAYVVGNWFINTENAYNTSLTYQTLDIHYTNWNSTEEVAWLAYNATSGYQFVIYQPDTTTPINPSTCLSDGTCALSSSIQYVGTDGSDYTASITGSGVPEGYVGAATTTSLTTSAPSPALVGQPVTLTATISENSATGTVAFTAGSTTLCAAAPVVGTSVPEGGGGGGIVVYQIEAQASCTVTFTNAGSTQVTAAYSGGTPSSVVGNTWDEASEGQLTLDLVNQVATTTTVGASDSSPVVGEPVTYTATVADSATGPAPTGTVTFANGTTAFCSASISLTTPYTATCSQTYLSPGEESVTASYPGDTYTIKSSNSTTINVSAAGTTTSLSASPGAPVFGQSVSLTAQVSGTGLSTNGPVPTGTVTFTVDGSEVGNPVALSGGQATSTAITNLAPGVHQVKATYAGDTNYTGSSTTSSTSVSCTTTITSSSNGALTTGPGTCVEGGGTINGPVNVGQGGALAVIGGTITGPVHISGASSILICGSTIRGPVSITGTAGPVAFGGPAGSSCGPDQLVGPVTIEGGGGPVSVQGSKVTGPVTIASVNGAVVLSSNTISGPVTLSGNTAASPPTVSANTVGGPLSCRSNNPAPVDAGSPNTVSGPASGQCASLA